MQLERTILLSDNWKIEVDAYNYALKYKDKHTWKVVGYHRSLNEAIAKYIDCRFLEQEDAIELYEIADEISYLKNHLISELLECIEVD